MIPKELRDSQQNRDCTIQGATVRKPVSVPHDMAKATTRKNKQELPGLTGWPRISSRLLMNRHCFGLHRAHYGATSLVGLESGLNCLYFPSELDDLRLLRADQLFLF